MQAVDGYQNTNAAECQHWNPGRSSPTGTVVRIVSQSRPELYRELFISKV